MRALLAMLALAACVSCASDPWPRAEPCAIGDRISSATKTMVCVGNDIWNEVPVEASPTDLYLRGFVLLGDDCCGPSWMCEVCR